LKYIKTYESLKSESPYKVNDYVYFFDEDDIKEKFKNGIITELFVRKGTLWYEVTILEGDLKGFHTSLLLPDIKRLLTPEEIEEIQIKNSANNIFI